MRAALGARSGGEPLEEEGDLDDEAGAASSAGDRVQEIKGIVLIGVSLWLLVAMSSYYRPFDDPSARDRNWGGQVGFYFANLVFMSTGVAGVLMGLLGLAWGAVLVARKQVALAALRLFSALCFVLSVAFLIEMAFGGEVRPDNRMPYGPGGWLALQSTPALQEKFGGPGLVILLVLVAVVSFMLATEMAFYPALAAFARWLRGRREERGEGLAAALAGWMRRLALGLWDFLRGARIGESAEMRAQETGAAAVLEPVKPRRSRSYHPRQVDDGEVEPEPIVPAAPMRVSSGQESEGGESPAEAPAPAESSTSDEEEAAGEGVAGEEEDADPHELEGAEDEAALDPGEEELEPVSPARRRGGNGARNPLFDAEGSELETRPLDEWILPPVSLLESPDRASAFDNRQIEDNARKLEHVLSTFRVEATVVSAQVGPTVILYELEVTQGTRMNKVQQLSQEIAAALRAQSVRIIAPIPGKSTIGIEVPSQNRRVVRVSELVTPKVYEGKFYAIPLFLGVDVEGLPIVEDLSRMPHILIAGTTGSGKSVCINSILASILLTRSPHDVQMILIDPKMVELQMFAKIPHLMLPVVTDMRQATQVLNWAVEKMEGRYELFQGAGVKNIRGYNELSEDELRQHMGAAWSEERTPRHLPYIVVVIDEFADLMMASRKEAELAITRLAQKSRAVGLHVILATQRPSIDVITGLIKGNLPTRIAFQVASKVDSRVILDVQGAEKLLGGGDMLYTPPASGRVKRVQGALVQDHEIQALVDFVCRESAPRFNQELVQVATGSSAPGGGGFESALEDDLWDEAVRVILKSKRGSASLLQRALGIGYTRASRLLDMMGEAGIVSDHKGSKAREVLMTLEEWEQKHGAPLEQGSPGASDEP